MFTYKNSSWIKLIKRGTALFMLVAFSLASCEKRTFDGTPANLQFYNSMDDGIDLVVNMKGTHPIPYASALTLFNKDYREAQSRTLVDKGSNPLSLYALPDTLPKDLPALSLNLELVEGAIYSLFIFGNKSSVEYLLHKDAIPPISLVDSVTNIRVVNLSGDQKISVNLKGKSTGSLVAGLPFKQLSGFMKLPADQSVSEYIFEIRDADTGDFLAAYTASDINKFENNNKWLNQSTTLVFSGQLGGAGVNAQKVSPMRHK